MSEFFNSLSWHTLVAFWVFVFPVFSQVKDGHQRLKGHYRHGDKALLKTLLIKTLLPAVAVGVALMGLFISSEIRDSIWSWIIGFGCLFVSAGLFGLFYFGPLYPLFDELEDAEMRADRFVDSNPSQQGN